MAMAEADILGSLENQNTRSVMSLAADLVNKIKTMAEALWVGRTTVAVHPENAEWMDQLNANLPSMYLPQLVERGEKIYAIYHKESDDAKIEALRKNSDTYNFYPLFPVAMANPTIKGLTGVVQNKGYWLVTTR